MSKYGQQTEVKHLQVRGMKAVRFAAIVTAIGLNIFRVNRYKRRDNTPLASKWNAILVYLLIYSYVKERIVRQTQNIMAVFHIPTESSILAFYETIKDNF